MRKIELFLCFCRCLKWPTQLKIVGIYIWSIIIYVWKIGKPGSLKPVVGNVWSILPLLCQLKYCALIPKQKLAGGLLCSPSWPQIFDPASASQLFGLLCLVSDVSSSKLVGLKWGKGGCLCMQIKLMIWLGSSFSQFKYISVMSPLTDLSLSQ